MSDESSGAEPKKKKKGGKFGKIGLIVGAVALLGGGGAAAGFYVAGGMTHKEAKPEDPFSPKLVKKGQTAEEVAAEWTAKAEEAMKEKGGEHGAQEGKATGHAKGVDLPRPKQPSLYQATYFQIPAPFTSNMSDSDSFAQISIAVSTYYDNRVIQAVQTHELAIRSSILMMLAQESELDLSTPEGKEKLQEKLVRLINEVLKQRTGYGGVDNVYFTNFVIQ